MKWEKNIRILHISCLPFSKKHDATEKVNRPAKEKLGRKFEKLGEMSRFYVTNDLECKILILNIGNMQQVSVSSFAHYICVVDPEGGKEILDIIKSNNLKIRIKISR